MRREPGARMEADDEAFARRLAPIAARLRDEGVPPAHDLWPGICLALDAAAAGGARQRARRPVPRWPLATLAASVLLLVGLGLSGWQPGAAPDAAHGLRAAAPAVAPAATKAPGPVATREGLRAVEAALDELHAALKLAPDDPELSRLVLLIHHSRGRLLRLQAEGGAREARRGPA